MTHLPSTENDTLPSREASGFANGLRRQWRLRPERNIQIAIAIVAGLLFISPVLAVVVGAFRTSPFTEGPHAGEWSVEPFLEVMSNPQTWETLGNTVLLTVVSVVPGIILAIFFATLVTRTNAPVKWLITGMMAVMVAVPPLFYALTWSMLGNSTVGLLNVWLRGIGSGFADGYQWGEGPLNIESWAGLIIVSIFRGTAFMYLILVGPFSSMDRSLEEAARVSGAGPVRTFFGTQLPVLLPAITAVLIISAVASLEAFDIPVVLGVPADIYVLPTEVFRYLNEAGNPLYGQASAVSIILLVILLVLIALERRVQGRKRFTTVTGKGSSSGLWGLGAWRAPVAVFTILYAIVAVGLPLAQLVLVALSPYFGATEGWTWENFEQVLSQPGTWTMFLSTAGIAALASTVAIVVVVAVLWAAKLRRGPLATFLDSSQLLPLIVPGLLLALGLITVVLLGPLKFVYGSWLLLMVALFVSAVPLASRSIAGAIAQIPAELEEATRVSGGSRTTGLVSVVLRLLLPSALNGWLLCFVVVSGSLAIPMLLGQRSQPMLAIKVYDDYLAGNFTLAAVSFVLFIVEIIVIAIVIEAIKRLLTRRTSRRRDAAVLQGVDPEWTGAITTPRPRGRLRSRTSAGVRD